jgi:hypothetical protein
MVADHRCYNPGHIKPAVNAVFAQTGNFEKSITAGREIHDPMYRIRYTLLFVHHTDDDACNLRKMFRHKA